MSVAIEASVSLWDRVDKLWEFLITLKQNTSSYMWNQSEMRKLLAKRAIEKWNVQWLIIYMTKIPIQSFTCCTFLIFINTPQLYFSYSVTRHLHAQSFLISRLRAHLHFAFFILCIINNTQSFFFFTCTHAQAETQSGGNIWDNNNSVFQTSQAPPLPSEDPRGTRTLWLNRAVTPSCDNLHDHKHTHTHVLHPWIFHPAVAKILLLLRIAWLHGLAPQKITDLLPPGPWGHSNNFSHLQTWGDWAKLPVSPSYCSLIGLFLAIVLNHG